MATYQDQLRDVEWQKKRLEVMQRDDWTCTRCGRVTGEMNVHHKRYRKGMPPWLSPLDELTTFCRNCHEVEHGLKRIGDVSASRLPMLKPTAEDYAVAAKARAELKRILGVE